MDIEIKNLYKKYDQKIAVNHISFSIKKGVPLAILGRNGSGKSTTIKSILGLKQPTSGEIVLPKGIQIGYLPEERGVYYDATVKEHLVLFGKLSGVKNLNHKIDEWLKELEIEQYRDFKMKFLSKGTAQKVQLIITLLHNPEFVILDEPFSGLDPVNTRLFYKVIQKHCQNKYLLVSSHQMNQVEGLCNDVVMLNNGNVVAQGKIQDLKMKYGHSSIMVPYSDEVYDLLKEYSPKKKGDNLTVDLVDDEDSYKEIIEKLIHCPLILNYLKFDQMSMNELFIRLLGD